MLQDSLLLTHSHLLIINVGFIKQVAVGKKNQVPKGNLAKITMI